LTDKSQCQQSKNFFSKKSRNHPPINAITVGMKNSRKKLPT
jgi:hypothetical protein